MSNHRLQWQENVFGGGSVGHLERFLIREIGQPYAMTTNSGSAALFAGLVALGLTKGAKVALPSLVWEQTIHCLRLTGAEPDFSPVCPNCGNLDPERLPKRPRFQALLAQHVFGCASHSRALAGWCREKGVLMIEDLSHAYGASADGLPAGSWGDVAFLSLSGSKPFGAGEGGAVLFAHRDPWLRALQAFRHPAHRELDRLSAIGPLPPFVLSLRMDGGAGQAILSTLKRWKVWSRGCRRDLAGLLKDEGGLKGNRLWGEQSPSKRAMGYIAFSGGQPLGKFLRYGSTTWQRISFSGWRTPESGCIPPLQVYRFVPPPNPDRPL